MMRKGFLPIIALMLLVAITPVTQTSWVSNGIVEENNLWIGPEEKSKGISEAEFNNIIDRVIAIYEPIIAQMRKRLVVIRKWSDGTVNAYARQSGNMMEVTMFGGLARHEAVTLEGFAMVICHEMGHHLGGAPKMSSFFGTAWASNEGQSDYWAAMKCMKKLFETDDNISTVEQLPIPGHLANKCNEVFQNAHDSAICQRSAMGGHSLGELFRHLRNLEIPVRFDTPDQKVVTRTQDKHPDPQCRLDTYFQGALCDKDPYEDTSSSNATIGVCTRQAGYENGVRPLCWYKP